MKDLPSGQQVIFHPPQVVGSYVCSTLGAYWLLTTNKMCKYSAIRMVRMVNCEDRLGTGPPRAGT